VIFVFATVLRGVLLSLTHLFDTLIVNYYPRLAITLSSFVPENLVLATRILSFTVSFLDSVSDGILNLPRISLYLMSRISPLFSSRLLSCFLVCQGTFLPRCGAPM
jgi:hypothetical protein